jgi:hypothetical protein
VFKQGIYSFPGNRSKITILKSPGNDYAEQYTSKISQGGVVWFVKPFRETGAAFFKGIKVLFFHLIEVVLQVFNFDL